MAHACLQIRGSTRKHGTSHKQDSGAFTVCYKDYLTEIYFALLLNAKKPVTDQSSADGRALFSFLLPASLCPHCCVSFKAIKPRNVPESDSRIIQSSHKRLPGMTTLTVSFLIATRVSGFRDFCLKRPRGGRVKKTFLRVNISGDKEAPCFLENERNSREGCRGGKREAGSDTEPGSRELKQSKTSLLNHLFDFVDIQLNEVEAGDVPCHNQAHHRSVWVTFGWEEHM